MTTHAVDAVIHDADPPHPPMPAPPPPPKGTVRLGDLLGRPDYPNSLYDLLAASGRPALYAADYRLWVIHRHGDVLRALTDTGGDDSAYSNALTLFPVYQPCDAALAILERLDVPPTTAGADNPTHARTVRALRATFPNTAAKVEAAYGEVVDRRVDQLTEYVRARTRGMHTVDLAAEFASLLPLWVICDLLGVTSADDIAAIKAWADGQCALVWGQPDEAEQVRLAQGLLDFWQWTQTHVQRREDERLAGRPGGDWVGAILRWRDVNGGDTALTMPEVASLAFNLLVAGHETTAGLIAHCLDAALSDGSWRALSADPTLIPDHVERMLRCRPPIDGWLRLAKRDIHLDGATIPAGARVLCLIGAANREGGELLSFGHGAHYCVGAALARLEAQRALAALTARLPGLKLAPRWRREYEPNLAFRHHRNLLVVA